MVVSISPSFGQATQAVHFSAATPPVVSAARFGNTQPAPKTQANSAAVGQILQPIFNACKQGLREVTQNLGNTALWTASMFILGFVPFLHFFLLPAAVTFPVLATMDFLKGFVTSLAKEPLLKTTAQQVGRQAQSFGKQAQAAWQAANTPAANTPNDTSTQKS
ncbi:MAG: hypothetical protein VKK59_04715 [Vampirovibrionales bacterium]|nr:hypothetical protein [Vampirovibrionales bacterium]